MSSPDDELAEITEDMLREHVSEVMFDPGSQFEPDCVFCRRAVQLGYFAAFGIGPDDLA